MTGFPVPTMPAPPVSVVGLGQLGGSLAAALTAAGRPVSGWDVDPAAREVAEAHGVRVSQELTGVDVLAVPLPVMGTALDGLRIDPGATVTDLGSVKVPVLAELGPALGDRLRERDEALAVRLRNPSHARIAVATALGTIVNDD